MRAKSLPFLLSLVRDEKSVAGRVFKELGLDPQRVETLVKQKSQSDLLKPSATPSPSYQAKKVIESAVDGVLQKGRRNIHADDILLALVSYEEGTAVEVLKEVDITPDQVRERTRIISSLN